MFHEALVKVMGRADLSAAEASAAMHEIVDGGVAPAQVAGLLVGLAMKGERPDEMTGFATAMRERAVEVPVEPGTTTDLCGTGGDRSGTFNISSAAAIVTAACGVRVAKHGNRSVSSRCGSADVFEALGVDLTAGPEALARCLNRAGIAFLFAPAMHPSTRHVVAVRRELGVRTAFNLLGPLTNPAGARRQVVGVGDPAAAGRVADVLRALGTERALVVHGAGLDELPLDGSGVIHDVTPAGVERRTVDARGLGLATAETAALAGGSPADNAVLVEGVLDGTDRGPRRDVVLLNAAAAFVAAGRVSDLAAGVALAAATIDDGSAAALLARLRAENAAARVTA